MTRKKIKFWDCTIYKHFKNCALFLDIKFVNIFKEKKSDCISRLGVFSCVKATQVARRSIDEEVKLADYF